MKPYFRLILTVILLSVPLQIILAQDNLDLHQISTLEINWDVIDDIALYDDYAFIAARTSDLRIMDLSNSPAMTHITTITGNYNYLTISPEREKLFLYEPSHNRHKAYSIADPTNPDYLCSFSLNVNDSTHWMGIQGDTLVSIHSNGTIRWFDVSQQSPMTVISTLNTDIEVTDACYKNGILAIVDKENCELSIIDCHSALNPSLVQTINLNQNTYAVFVEIIESNVLILSRYTAGGTHNELTSINFSDIQNPDTLSTIPVGSYPRAISVNNTQVFIITDSDGISVYSYIDPENPVEITSFPANSGSKICLWNNYCFTQSGLYTLNYFDFNDLTEPELLSTFEKYGCGVNVVVEGNYAYVANLSGGIVIVDISDLENPLEISRIKTNLSNAHKVIPVNDYLITDGYSDLYSIDKSDIYNPQVVDSISAYSNLEPGDFVVSENVLIISHITYQGETELISVEITDIGNFGNSSSIFLPGRINKMCIDNGYLYTIFKYNTSTGCIRTFDISDPMNPELVSFTPMSDYNKAIDVDGPRLCVGKGTFTNGFYVFDTSNPILPIEMGSIDSAYYFHDLKIQDNHVFMNYYTGGIRVYDISDASEPLLVETKPVSGEGRGFCVEDEFVAVADDYHLIILGIEITDVEEYSCDIPTSFGIKNIYPVPFNSSVTIEVDIQQPCLLEARIYDILGREVDFQQNKYLTPGSTSMTWKPNLASGIYYLTINNNLGWSETRKLVYIR